MRQAQYYIPLKPSFGRKRRKDPKSLKATWDIQ